jgi:hypothetical protein
MLPALMLWKELKIESRLSASTEMLEVLKAEIILNFMLKDEGPCNIFIFMG